MTGKCADKPNFVRTLCGTKKKIGTFLVFWGVKNSIQPFGRMRNFDWKMCGIIAP